MVFLAYSALIGPNRSVSRYCQCGNMSSTIPPPRPGAVVPGRPLRRDLVALEHPVAELQPDRQHPAEEVLADQPLQLHHAGQEQLVVHHPVGDPGGLGRAGQPQRAGQRAGHRLLGVDVLACLDRLQQGDLARAGDLGVEVDVDAGVGQHLVQVGGPALQAVPFGDGAQPLLVAPDQDRLGVHGGAVLEPHAALLPDGEQGADQVLPVSHPAGDTVEGDVDDLARHGSALRLGLSVGGECDANLNTRESAFPD